MRIILSNVVAIYRRELQSYFVSPLAYAIACIFWLVAGFFFYVILWDENVGILNYSSGVDSASQQLATFIPFDAGTKLINDFLNSLTWLLFFILPALSMGLYTEERKRGTLELLATSPVTNWAVALGKLLGVLTFFITMILPMLALEAIALSSSNPPMALALPFLGHLALILLAAAILSLGMFISSLTDSTILSAIFTFLSTLVILVLPEYLAQRFPNTIGEFIGHFSLLKHYNNLIQGIFDTSSLILFASYIFLGIFLTAQSIDAFRFQRQ
ncbi:MAG TPA: ABC transporter permease [Nostocaceae cyanobacterium]|nr:ABC transporter permease [Nostocaceae cyanobacterium]